MVPCLEKKGMAENMKVAIYGAGVRGRRIVAKWGGTEREEIVGVFDREKTGDLMGVPILRYEDGPRELPVVISLAKLSLAIEVEKDLRSAGYQKIYWYRENPYEDTLEGQLDDMGTWGDAVLTQVEMHVSDACNLNCRGCTHFSPLFHQIDADVASRLEDVEKLAGKVSHILNFFLLGGEPFLNPEISAYVEGLQKILPHTRRTIVTNGLLIPKLPQEVLDSIRRTKTFISISEYEPTHEAIEEITARLEEAGIAYELRSFDSKQLFNKPVETVPSGKYPQKCISDGCVNIYNGKICRCPTLMYAFKFNETFGEHLPTEGILNLEDAPSGEELLNWLKEPVPLCVHCVENPIPWGRCEGTPAISDFAATEERQME